MNKHRIIAAMVAVVLGMTTNASTAEDDASGKLLIIYDSSNSMWGELKDRTRKYEAGREALGKLLQSDLGDRQVGFRAYGHRRKEDCSDTELMVGFGDAAGAAGQISRAVGGITPRGRTPITHSLREGLKDIGDGEGDILLITDGIETCDADPCALMEEWKASNVDIRVHVVGVGLDAAEREAVGCIAEISGGRYLDADSAERFAEALGEVRQAVAEPPVKKQLKSTVAEPAKPKKPDIETYEIRLIGRDSQGRDYIIAGTLKNAESEARDIRSDRRNTVDGPGDYVIEAGPILADGSIYEPGSHSFAVDPSKAVTDVVVPVKRPAIVTANFAEDEKPHRGALVEVYRDGEKLFHFQPGPIGNRSEVLMRPGSYRFQAQPNPDNKLTINGSLNAGEETELLFELLTTVRAYISFRLPNGEIISRNSELWQDGGLAYEAHGRNGALVRPGSYEIRSDDFLLPATPTEVQISEKEQEVIIPIAAGFIEIAYADKPEDFLTNPSRAWIYPSAKTSYAYARLNTPIAVVPGNYRVEPHDALGYFDPGTPFDIASGETVKVLIEPKPLGTLIVTYAPSDDYPSNPDRAFASAMDNQPLKNGFMRPGRPLKVLPGRYSVAGRKGFDMDPAEVEVRSGETTEVVLKLRHQE